MIPITAVADTHVALWYLFDSLRLSEAAANAIEDAAAARHKIAVSTISLAEVVYLVEKGRVSPDAYRELRRVLANPKHVFVEALLSAAVVDSMRFVLRAEVPDMPDRIVAATAVELNVPIISRDRKIRSANLQTIW